MRYPTNRGLAISPYELGYTQPDQPIKGLTTNHHLYFCKDWYQGTRYRQIFRGLVSNVFPMLRVEHNEGHDTLHDTYDPPIMPKDSLMIEVIEGVLAERGVIQCVYEKKTNLTYDIQPAQWARFRGEYRGACAR